VQKFKGVACPTGKVRLRTMPKIKSRVRLGIAVLNHNRAKRFERRQAKFLETGNRRNEQQTSAREALARRNGFPTADKDARNCRNRLLDPLMEA
jgi:hypothetical protein